MAAERFTVRVPDRAYWREQIKCQAECPVRTDSRGYVRAIAQGDYEKAYLIARAPNPLASICGRICGAPCEAACRRADIDEAVSIRALKRFVSSRFGPEAGLEGGKELGHVRRNWDAAADCADYEVTENLLRHFNDVDLPVEGSGKSVGIIGSGPAGLAAAHDLCLMGVKPVIYEMEPVPAGMLYLGVPSYRLPRELIRAEVSVIEAMGTEIRCNVAVGKDVTLAELRQSHDAVLIAVGAKKSRKIPLPNIDAPGVIGGVDLLRDIALGQGHELGEKVVVIGGGNVAYDVARTLVRQTGYDVSRTLVRQSGVQQVHLVSLESLDEMPADSVEIEEGEEEGVIRHNSWGPREILVDDAGRARGVKFVRCSRVFGDDGRFAPVFDEAESMVLEADQVFLSVGQTVDLSFVDAADVELTDRGLLQLDDTKVVTRGEGVFAAGDVALGPGLMIDAIASGKQAARAIYKHLTGVELGLESTCVHSMVKGYSREAGFESLPREEIPAMSAEERKGSMEAVVELGFGEEQGERQGARCLDCAVNTIFNGDRCILCGGCADVCPERCLRLVSVGRLEGDESLAQLVAARYGDAGPGGAGAIIKDETRCIRCGLCSESCPVDAFTMVSFRFQEVIK